MREITRLKLDKCTKEVLESLPPNIRVDGILSFYENKNLTSLPKGLKVGGYLFLAGCELLESLPQDLQVGGDIFYDYETGFTNIEGWMDDPTIIPTHLRGKL